MAQLILGSIGAAVGSIFGPVGTAIGWSLGAGLGGALNKPKAQKPPVGDLNAPELTYGAPLPRLWGTVATAGALAWMSDKRYVEQTEEVGKGGGQTVTTGYTYSADMMFIVAIESDVVALTRVWRNGKLVWSQRAGATADTFTESADTPLWDAIELRAGGPSQMPWSVYETAVGTANALAYRRRATVCITNAQFGSSPTPPSYIFEVITAGTAAPGNVFFLLNFESGAAVDESSWAHYVAVENATVSGGSAKFGTYNLQNTTTINNSSGVTAKTNDPPNFSNINVPWDMATEGLTMEAWWYIASNPNQSWFMRVVASGGGGELLQATLSDAVSPDERAWQITIHNQIFTSPSVPGPDYPVPWSFGTYNHVACDWDPATKTATMYVNGAVAFQGTYSGSIPSAPSTSTITAANVLYTSGGVTADTFRWDGIRFTRRVRRYTASFSPPTSAPIDDGGLIFEPTTEDLDDVVREICVDAQPLAASLLDVTALNNTPVRGFAAVGSPKQALEELAAAFFFSCVSRDKLYFRKRGAASAVTIPYARLAAGVNEAAEEALELTRGNDDEVPRKISLTYTNYNADHEPGTVLGDRGAGRANQVETRTLALVLTPDEAQKIADVWATDAKFAATTFAPSVSDYHAAIEPTDVITITDQDGSTFRVRVVAENYANNVKQLEAVLDDASLLTQPGVATDNTTQSISLSAVSETTARLLDIPVLRDADNDPGFYVAAARTVSTRLWPGYSLAESIGGSAYSTIYTSTAEATMGIASTVLGNYTGVGFDEINTVRVSVNGTLASSTRDAILAGTGTAYLIGSEIVYARTATLVSAGVYDLSGLLRGLRGTEWAMSSHGSSERVVVLSATTLRRVVRDAAEIGLAYNYKAWTFGRSINSVTAQSFTDTGIALKPFAPTDLRVARDASNNATITIKRRTRLSHRFLSAGIDAPLGETTASYALVIYSSNSYATVLRTITSTTESFSYTAAQQTSDGLTPGNTLYLRAYQVSSTVGYGYPLQAAA